jgi:hypothetical protein
MLHHVHNHCVMRPAVQGTNISDQNVVTIHEDGLATKQGAMAIKAQGPMLRTGGANKQQ